ncbi:hypothetical protein [Rhodanobacter sp. L36]|uniref:hypothetical protein n=1 Tax=Rhodanobacter sp. L36 TaxID=1747221 RepID=UPI00131C4034|nr:hypothetical protein [Rhodanobacter sp. L36]
MKTRRVFSTPDLTTARTAMSAARSAGIADKDISLVARDDIEIEKIPDHRLTDHHDSSPGAMRGVALGGGSGLLLGLIAIAVPPLGLTLAGAAAMTVAGAAVGAWTGALIGLDVPDAISRTFQDEIAAGRILLVLDGEQPQLDAAQAGVVDTGAVPLPFSTPTVMT